MNWNIPVQTKNSGDIQNTARNQEARFIFNFYLHPIRQFDIAGACAK